MQSPQMLNITSRLLKKYKLIPIHTQRQHTKLFFVSLKSPEEIKAAIDSHRESKMVAKI